ncbi:MAG: PKD domain-containing protein [Bacteroidetes bacterium]|nr:PKD domain-containing protein [Bacteroidota bacterium]
MYIGTASTYNVTLISNSLNGCADTIQKSIRIANQPTPWFILNEDTVCTMSMLQFTDSSVAGAGDTITNRYWDFGDGTIDSTSINPLHFYSLPGVYTITLRVTSPENCDSTIARTVFIIESPQAIFTTSNVCLGEESIFIDSSTSPAGSTINSWQWDFGDGSGATNSNTQHLFTNSGNYTVTLVVSSDIGCFDTTFKQINIYELPSAYFTTGKSCTNLPVQFTDSSTSGSPIIGWEWNFGSGLGISTLQHPTFSFPSALAYNVSLVVTSAENCKDTSDKFIAVEQTPEFTIATTDQCLGSNANFNFIPSPGSSSNLSYLWNFGDSTASFLPNPSHLYSSDGIYAVELSVTDLNNSCVGILKDSVTIFPLPVAGFTNSSACIGAPVSFTDTSQISNGTISNWSWKFSNFGTSALEDPQFTYSSTGTFPVSLLVSSSLGCKDSITKSINVNSIPEVSFQASPNYGAPPLVVQYINNSDNGAYSWTFGDNSSGSNSFSPLHQYNDTGIFQTTLIVVDSNGCKDSSSQFIYVFIPEPDLSINGVSFNKINNLWVLKALISNTGNEDAFRFVLKAELEGATVLYETFDNDTLKAGTMNEYLFKSKFEGTGINPSWFCSEIISINDKPDEIKTNNRFCITTSLKFEVYSVYPSPFENEIYMGINMPVTGEISIHLTDLLGRSCIEERRMLLSEGFNTIQLNTPELQSSIYLLKIVSGDDSKIIRIIKK